MAEASAGERNGQQDVQKVGEGRKEGRRQAGRCEPDPPRRRQPSDREGRRRRPRAGLHRGHAGLETRPREAPRRAHRAERAQGAQGREVELAVVRHRGPGLVPGAPHLHALRQGGLLPRRLAATGPARRQPRQGHALHRHPRRRRARRGADGELGEAGRRVARLSRASTLTRPRGATPSDELAVSRGAECRNGCRPHAALARMIGDWYLRKIEKQPNEVQTNMKKSATTKGESPSRLIDARIKELDDWRGKMLFHVRALIKQADPEVVEEWKWRGVPVWSHDGLICTGETYKSVVKLTFAKGASLKDPSGLFNSSLEGNTRRAIDIHEGDEIDEDAFKTLIRAAATLNRSSAR